MRRGRFNRDVPIPTGGQMEPCACGGKEMVSIVCKQCQELLCEECSSTRHRHHATDIVSTVATELRRTIQTTVSTEKKNALLKNALEKQSMVAAFKKELIEMETGEIVKLDEHIDGLVTTLTEIRLELVKTLSGVVRDETERLNKTERALTRMVSSVTSICDKADDLLSSTDDIDVVRRGFVFSDELSEVFGTDSTPPPVKGRGFTVRFVPGVIDQAVLRAVCGEVTVGGLGIQPTRAKDVSSGSNFDGRWKKQFANLQEDYQKLLEENQRKHNQTRALEKELEDMKERIRLAQAEYKTLYVENRLLQRKMTKSNVESVKQVGEEKCLNEKSPTREHKASSGKKKQLKEPKQRPISQSKRLPRVSRPTKRPEAEDEEKWSFEAIVDDTEKLSNVFFIVY
ncbi:hypothetical protein ScPMuIL_017069 [Solemya velum]